MSRDNEKSRERQRRYREKLKIEKFGAETVGVDLRGRVGAQVRGPAHPRWNNTRMINGDGYVKIRVGKEHPLADPNGYAYEHLLVWASAGFSLPLFGEILHHQDEVKSNNQISNLRLMSRSEHNALHIAARQRDPKTGRLHNGMPPSPCGAAIGGAA